MTSNSTSNGVELVYSQFNSIIKVSEQTQVIYNSLSHVCVFEPLTFKLDNPLNLSSSKLSFYIKHGIVVPANINEFELAQKIFIETISASNRFILTINPTLECNFRCWYCYETHNSKMVMSDAMIDRMRKLIANIINEHEELLLAFFGGEPLMEFDRVVKPLMEFAHAKCIEAGKDIEYMFTTNGFLLDQNKVDFLKQYRCHPFQITLDGGPEFHNRTRVSKSADSFMTIVKNIRLLCQNGLPVLLRLNLTNANIKSAFEIPSYFSNFTVDEKRGIKMICEHVWQDMKNGSLVDQIISLRKEFRKIGIKSEIRNKDSIRSACYADKLRAVTVNFNGDIFKCTAEDFTTANRNGKVTDDGIIEFIGNPFEEMLQKRNDKKMCHSCRILPLCNGGCFKKIMKHDVETCFFPTDEDKNKLVLENIEEAIFEKTI